MVGCWSQNVFSQWFFGLNELLIEIFKNTGSLEGSFWVIGYELNRYEVVFRKNGFLVEIAKVTELLKRLLQGTCAACHFY